MPVDDVVKDAQNEGYQDGLAGRKNPTKYAQFGHLRAAYERGWVLGYTDKCDRENKEARQAPRPVNANTPNPSTGWL